MAFQQSGTAAEEPPSLGPATQVVPVQSPHLISQPYSKSPTPPPAFTLIGIQDSGHEQSSGSPRLPPPSPPPRGEALGGVALGFFQKNVTHPNPLLDRL